MTGFRPHEATPAEIAERLAADRAGEPYLLLRDGERRQCIVSLAGRERLTIGRAPGHDLVLDWDAQVSRIHAVLESAGPDWTIVDDGLSRNGTYVNELRLGKRHRLVHGDRIRVGATTMAFRSEPAGAGGTTVVEGGRAAPAVSDAQRRVLVALCRPFAGSGAFPVAASNRQIAEELSVSLDTVRTHIRSLFERFDVPELPQNAKRAELARRALTSATVRPEDLNR